MLRSGFKRPEPRPTKTVKSLNLAPRPISRGSGLLAAAMELTPASTKVEPKTPDRKQQAIRDSARGEDCTVRIPGACTFDPTKTIWSHAPLGAAGKGRGIKALDLCGAYCCTACDAVIDGQAAPPPGYSRTEAVTDWFFGHMRSLVRLRQKGLV